MEEIATLPLERCTVCGAPGDTPAELGLLRCTSCGAVRAPEYADPEALYVDGYYSGEAGSFGLDVRHPRFQAFLLEVGGQRVQWLERNGASRGSLVDVGAGTGEFLAAARDRGWEVAGAEPIAESASIARDRGLDVRTAMLADSGLPERAFDVVSALHVLEHLAAPVEFLREIARWARPGGLVMIEVPNYDSTLRLVSGQSWIHLRRLEHLTHFTPESLTTAFTLAGLEPVAVRTPTFASRAHTLDEAAAVAGRPAWADKLRPLSPKREVLGQEVPVPGAFGLAVFAAAAARDDRRGRGMVVRALARVPA